MKKTPPTAAAGGNKWLKLLILALFAGAIGAFFAFGGQHYLSLDTIKSNRDALLTFTHDHQLATLAIAFVVYTLAVAGSLPGAIVLSLTCGFLFGRWLGSLVKIGRASCSERVSVLV